MARRGPHRHRLLFAAIIALLSGVVPVSAYSPGSGSIYSDDFEGVLDEDWEMESGLLTATSPWDQVPDGGDTSFQADGKGPFPGSPSRHWAGHFLHPVPATSFSIAMEFRAELGPGYLFDLEIAQRAPVLRRYRLRITGDGTMSLWRSESGVMVQQASTATGEVPAGLKRWLRFAIEPDASGHPRVRARVWGGSAAAEPSSWTLEFLDDRDTIARVHRFELIADGPRDVRTWIDDLDAWGDPGNGVLSTITKIYIVEHSHVDIGFTKPPDDIEQFAKDHLDQVLANLDADPAYRWTIENGWCLDRWWERSTDTDRQRMIDYLRAGRIRLAANYTNLTTAAAGHEELSRAVYYSTRMGREHGFPVRTWFQDDVPGATFALPEMLARSGIEFYVGGMNTSFGGELTSPNHGDQPFWWTGPDGSRVLAWISFDSYTAAFDYGFSFFDTIDDMYRKLGKKLPEMEEAGYPRPELMLQRAFDNHYQGFHARNLVNQWNATYDTPKFELSTADDFFDLLLAKYGPDAFPSFSGDFGPAWGYLTAYTPHTQAWMRKAHREARAAEAMLAAGATIDDAPVPHDRIDFLYRKILESDEHTNAGGWPGYFTPEEMDRNNRIHLGFARDARDTAAALLSEGIDRTLADLPVAGDAVVAVNPLGRRRDGWVRTTLPPSLYNSEFKVVDRSTGNELPYQRFDATEEILFHAADLPAVGYRVYDLVTGAPTATPQGLLAAAPTSLENDDYRLEVDPSSGAVVSLIHKPTGREMVDAGSSYRFNELATSTHQQATARQPPVAEPPASAAVTIELDGPLVAALKVTRTGSAHVETTYRLYRGEDRVEIENVFDRDQMDYVTNATHTISYFVTLPFDIHDFEIRSETTTRFLDPARDGFQRDTLFDYHDVEHTLDFWDGNVGVLYAIDNAMTHHFQTLSTIASSPLSNVNALLITRMKDKRDEYEYEGGTIGTYEQEPGTSPIYRFTHHFRATAPGFDPVAASRFGFEALNPPLVRVLGRRPGNLPDAAASFFAVAEPNVLLYTVKPAEDDDGIVLRLTELTGQPVTAHVSSGVFELASGERLEQDEEGGAPLSLSAGELLVPLGAYETATVRVRAGRSWAPITLQVSKDDASGDVLLEWSGGVSPYTLRRSESATFTGPVDTLVDEESVTSFTDPVLHDGRVYFYIVR